MATSPRSTAKERHPELFTPDSNIDRRGCKRIVPMEVMNLGFPRTGTMSMQTALNILGYSCYHSVQFFSNVKDCEMWNQALDAKLFNKGDKFTRTEWDSLLGNYSAVSADPPAICFAEELIDIYHEAKVILVDRDIEQYFNKAIIQRQWEPVLNMIANFDPFFVGPIRDCHRRWVVGWMGANNEEEMQKTAKPLYAKHYAMVRRVTPKERLLEYKMGDGWAPLCQFLGKPIPDVPFPKVNDDAAFSEMMALVMKRGAKNVARRVAFFVLPIIAVALSWWLLTYSR